MFKRIALGLLKDKPDDFEKHYKFFAAGIIIEVCASKFIINVCILKLMQSVYGFNIKPVNDPYVKIIEKGTDAVQGLLAGAFLVDALPFCTFHPNAYIELSQYE